MDRWCAWSDVSLVQDGDYLVADLMSLSGNPFHDEDDFLDVLAEEVMNRYESRPTPTLRILPQTLIENPRRSRRFYRRLFDSNEKPTQDFIAWAAETLAAWAEERLDNVQFVLQGAPHNNDPTFDVLAIVAEPEEEPYLRIEQIKATSENLTPNCNHAVHKFKRLEDGDYASELSNRLELLKAKYSNALGGVDMDELAFAPQYRVTVIHGKDRKRLRLLRTYSQRIHGGISRRQARFARVNWKDFWERLGERVYGQLR